MMELTLVFLGGVLGAGHCLGMCGPFVLAIGGGARNGFDAAIRQLAYSLGRVFTYAILGATAGFCGTRLETQSATLINIPAVLAIISGLWLLHAGLSAIGLVPHHVLGSILQRIRGQKKVAPTRPQPCLTGGMFGKLLREPGGKGAFLAGVFTGLLPCGLLYGMLALALATRSMLLGSATMAIFGLGTIPALFMAGMSGRLISVAMRRHIYTAAAWCLMLTGMISLVRGVSHLSIGSRVAPGCPMCAKR